MVDCFNQFLSQTDGYEKREWGQREDLMLASLCFDTGERFYEKGNHFCEGIEPKFCIYSSLPALQLLLGHKQSLTDKAVLKLEIFLSGGLKEFRKEIEKGKRNSFHLMAVAGIAGWGVYTSNKSLTDEAGNALEQFRQFCMDYDAPDEYVSPFYSAFQLAALAITADILVETESKKTACALENYIWKGILDRCHPILGQLVGPYSRGYLSELCGHDQAVLGALEVVLGECSPYSMERMLWKEENYSRIVPHGSLDCTRVHALYFHQVNYHCDPELIVHWRQRLYPCRLKSHTYTEGSYDVSIKKEVEEGRSFDYPPAIATQQAVMGGSCAVGWTDIEFENGMACNSFSFLYNKKGYTRACFTKLAVNEKYIGEWNTFEGLGMRLSECNFPDEGRKSVVETQDGWLIQYRPRAFCKDGHRIKLMFAITEHFGEVDAIRVDHQPFTEMEMGKEIRLTFLEILDGEFHYGLHPADGEGWWKIIRRNHFLCLEWHKEAEKPDSLSWNVLFFKRKKSDN